MFERPEPLLWGWGRAETAKERRGVMNAVVAFMVLVVARTVRGLDMIRGCCSVFRCLRELKMAGW